MNDLYIEIKELADSSVSKDDFLIKLVGYLVLKGVYYPHALEAKESIKTLLREGE